jgi:hypothetical protein
MIRVSEPSMAIDDQYDALSKAYPTKQSQLPEELAALVLRLALPGYVTEMLGLVCKRLRPDIQIERAIETLKLLVADMKDMKTQVAAAKQRIDDVTEAAQLRGSVRADVPGWTSFPFPARRSSVLAA